MNFVAVNSDLPTRQKNTMESEIPTDNFLALEY